MKTLLSSISVVALLAMSPLLPATASTEEDPLTSTVLLPVRVAGLGMGMAVGIPASAVRQTLENVPKCTRAIAGSLGGEDDPVSVVFALVPGTTAGIIQGVAEGCYYGVKNAVDNCVERPFSSAAFSLTPANERGE